MPLPQDTQEKPNYLQETPSVIYNLMLVTTKMQTVGKTLAVTRSLTCICWAVISARIAPMHVERSCACSALRGGGRTQSGCSVHTNHYTLSGTKTVDPVVLRPSRSSCALAACDRG